MKKTFANIRTLAALLIASAALAACSNDDGAIIGEQPAQEQAPQVYTLTLQAGKADNAQTRALKLETNGDLTAYWADGDVVAVTKGATALGTLSVKEGSISANGQTCTFTGELTGTVSTGDDLTLTYHPMASLSAFGSQNGQLVSAAACDMATASVKVAAVDDGTKTITVGTAEFKTQTAVLKINLQDTGGSALNATSLTISAGGAEIFTLSPLAVVGTLYFALPNAATVAAAKGITTDELAALPITFSAKVGDDTYTATKTGYPFAAGKYYETTLKMAKAAPSYDQELNLSTTSSDVIVPEGEHWLIKGYAEDICVTIGNGATVTLNGVEFSMDDLKPCIKCSGDATIILADGTTNTLTATGSYSGGIQAGPTDKTLTIKGNTGVLNVEIIHTNDATAIGAYDYTACGDIVIEGGVINATSQNGAAIGACYQAACGNITISGGTVTAKGGAEDYSGVGIGGHYYTACGDITITGGTVTATGFDLPGIGGDNICGDITISGGTVTATKGELADMCIGIGNSGTCGTITIGGTVYWDGSSYQNGGDTYLKQDQIIYPAP